MKSKKPHHRKRTPSSLHTTRALDPRKGPKRAAGARGKRRGLTFDDVKIPVILLGIVGICVSAFIVARPQMKKRQNEYLFTVCMGRVNELRSGLEQYRVDNHSGYGLMDLFITLKKRDNGASEQWMSEWCTGGPGGRDGEARWWTFLENLRIPPGASTYILTAYTKTDPPCLITSDPNRVWPPDLASCGKEPPVKF